MEAASRQAEEFPLPMQLVDCRVLKVCPGCCFSLFEPVSVSCDVNPGCLFWMGFKLDL